MTDSVGSMAVVVGRAGAGVKCGKTPARLDAGRGQLPIRNAKFCLRTVCELVIMWKRVLLGLGLAAIVGGSASAQVAAFESGRNDRVGYETWFAALGGDMRAGAEYWAGQRSLKSPGTCYGPSGQTLPSWTEGCLIARQRLALSDVRRKAEPDYRAGWNAIPASTPPRSTVPSAAAEAANANCTIVSGSGDNSGVLPGYVATQMIRDCEARRANAQRELQQERFATEQRERDASARLEEAQRANEAALREVAYREEAARAAAAKTAVEDHKRLALAEAETSPDNNCRQPKFAGDLIKSVSELKAFKAEDMKVIDIEHLITTKWDTATMDVVCHGVFVFENDRRIAASFEMRPNVAGDMLTRWLPD